MLLKYCGTCGGVVLAAALLCVSSVSAGDFRPDLDAELVYMDGNGGEQPGASGYDKLPRRFAEMNRYERIALQPYPEYDRLPLAEKARLYSQQFAQLHNRPPVFSPQTLAEIRNENVIEERRKNFYKPPAEKTVAKDIDLSSIPGPWTLDKAHEPMAAVTHAPSNPLQQGYSVSSDGDATPERDGRFETLKNGYNLRGAIRNGR